MVRRVILGSIVGSALVAALFVSQGCTLGEDGVWRIDFNPSGGWQKANCDPCQPIECCPCPWQESCAWPNDPPKLPDWCADWNADGGTLCADGGADSGMMSLCSSGSCVPSAPESWKHVAFVMAWASDPAACPAEAPDLVFEGVPAPPEPACPACSCDAPEGSCSVPAKWTISSTNCDNAGGGVQTNFNPPVGWDGSCSNANAIAPGKLCGGVPCVQSLTLSLPVIEEKPCVPHAAGEADLPVLRARSGGPETPIGRVCASNKPLPTCSGGGCTSTNPSFAACVMHDGDLACPEGWNGDRQVLYGQVDDTRECSPCGCDAPQGGTCQVKWRIFSDATCAAEIGGLDVSAGMMTAPCYSLDPGIALSGKTAEILDYTKGSCTPTGGKVVGDVKLDNQVTICCHSSTM